MSDDLSRREVLLELEPPDTSNLSLLRLTSPFSQSFLFILGLVPTLERLFLSHQDLSPTARTTGLAW